MHSQRPAGAFGENLKVSPGLRSFDYTKGIFLPRYRKSAASPQVTCRKTPPLSLPLYAWFPIKHAMTPPLQQSIVLSIHLDIISISNSSLLPREVFRKPRKRGGLHRR